MFEKILVLVDDQPTCAQVVHQGVEVARCNHSEILFFRLLPNLDRVPVGVNAMVVPPSVEYKREIRAQASVLLRKASSIAEAAGVLSFRSMGCGDFSSDAKCIADVAEKRGCQLIVVGTASRNALVRLMGGDIVPGLISSANVPVLVCQATAPSETSVRRPRFSRQERHSQVSFSDLSN